MDDTPVARHTNLLTDPVWGTIEVLPWESDLLNQHLLNRLHRITQTSSAYKVFPGMTASRFSHVLGTLHVANQMYIHAVQSLNPGSDIYQKVVDENRLAEHLFINGSLNSPGCEIPVESSEDLREVNFVAKFAAIPKDFAPLLVLIRLAAMLHDIGIPPYSHIFENALKDFLRTEGAPAWSRTVVWDGHTVDEKANSHKNELKACLNDREDAAPIHEQFGRALVCFLSHSIGGHSTYCIDDVVESGQNIGLPRLLHATAFLLTKMSRFQIGRSFIDSDLDADRVDYIYRDGYYSGMYSPGADFSRLFKCYEFAEHQEKGCPVARPSAKARIETTKLLTNRFIAYHSIYAHHKVHFFDELVRHYIYSDLLSGRLNQVLAAIKTIIKHYAPSAEEKNQAASHPQNVSALLADANLAQTLLLELDDKQIYQSMASAYVKEAADNNDYPRRWAISFLEDRKKYLSLFKTEFEYQEIRKSPQLVEDWEELERLVAAPDKRASPTGRFQAAWFGIANIVEAHRYELRMRLLSKFEDRYDDIMVASLSKLLQESFDSVSSSEFYSVSHLQKYLADWRWRSPPFNVWFARRGADLPGGDAKEELCRQLLYELSEITKRLSEH